MCSFLPITSEADLTCIIKCPVLNATKVGFSWKVKILRDCLYAALSSTSPHSHSVRIWRNNAKTQVPLHMPQNHPTKSKSFDALSIVAWKCRRILTSIPYIQHLITVGYDVIFLEEHWLWPFELSLSKMIHKDFTYTAVSDNHLNPSSDLTRGCGRVAILWHSSLSASPLFLSDCDRMCRLQIELKGVERCLSIVGIYMPNAAQPQDVYDSYFDSVDHCISQLSKKGPLLVLGDLNAHLGSRDTSVINSRGNKWIKMIDEHSLINTSLCSIAFGPTYTYTSGGNFTIIDYIISTQMPLGESLAALL